MDVCHKKEHWNETRRGKQTRVGGGKVGREEGGRKGRKKEGRWRLMCLLGVHNLERKWLVMGRTDI